MSVMCTVCMPGACGSQKKVQDALKLKLQMVDCKLLCGSWELDPDPLQEQPVLLTTDNNRAISQLFFCLFWMRKGFTVYSRMDWNSRCSSS